MRTTLDFPPSCLRSDHRSGYRLALGAPRAECPANAVLVQHRTELIAHKLPGLNRTPVLAAGQRVAQSLGELVAEQRAARLLKGMVFSLRRYPIKIQQSYFTIPSIILRWL